MRETIGPLSTLLTTSLLVTCSFGVAAQETPPGPAAPVEPISAILDAFEQHEVVAIGDPHGNEQVHALRLALIRDARFATTVDDIVVEWGNALYQDVMDRFVRGEDVPDADLRKVWRNTTQPGQGNDRPITEAFFRVVREFNASLRPERRLRVLLGDPPIDWDAVESRADHQEWLRLRDTHAAELVRREVLAKNRRALVVYGGMHLQRRNLLSNYELVDDPHLHTLVQQLEPEGDTRVFTVWPTAGSDLRELQRDAASWSVPALALTRGTALGSVDFAAFYPGTAPRLTFRDGRIVPVPSDQWRSLPMEEQFDAVLHLGPPAGMTTSWPSASLCLDAAYMDMRRERLSLAGTQRELRTVAAALRRCSALVGPQRRERIGLRCPP